MATIQELFSEFEHKLFHELFSPSWEPLAFALEDDGCCYPCDWRTEPIENIVRIEFWVEGGNQYVFSEKTKPDERGESYWTWPEIGEYPGCGKHVHTVSDIVPYVSRDSDAIIHPAVKQAMQAA